MAKVGLLYNSAYKETLFRGNDFVDLLEVVTDPYFVNPREGMLDELQHLANNYLIVSHSMGLSVGTVGIARRSDNYRSGLNRLLTNCSPDYFSDHFAFVNSGKNYLGRLQPIPPLEEMISPVTKNIKDLKRMFRRQMALENIVHDFPLRDSKTEYQFMSSVIKNADAGLLLDVTNLYVNSQNHGFDPEMALKILPLDRVIEIHLAGFSKVNGHLIDSHDNPIDKAVWKLFSRVLKLCKPKVVILERDSNMPGFGDLREELKRIRLLTIKHG